MVYIYIYQLNLKPFEYNKKLKGLLTLNVIYNIQKDHVKNLKNVKNAFAYTES